MTSRQSTTVSLFAFAAMTAMSVAQQQPPATIQRILFFKVKAERLADYESAIKEYNAVLTKASARHGFTNWVSLTGDREFGRVDNFAKWADMDTNSSAALPEQDRNDLQRIGTRITSYAETSRTVVLTILPELNTTAGQPLPPMVEVGWLRLPPGKTADFRALAKDELLPAEKQLGVKFFYVGVVEYGDYGAQAAVVTGMANWAELDKASSSDAVRSYRTKRNAIIISRKHDVYRYRPDLSYIPAPAQSTQR